VLLLQGVKLIIDRRAYLHWVRNVPSGIKSRSSILALLFHDKWIEAKSITEQVKLTHGTVMYHLRNLLREKIVDRNPDGPGWRLAENQQIELTEFIRTRRRRKSK